MKFILVSCLMLALVFAEEDVDMTNKGLPQQALQDKYPVKRGFLSYFYNYYDEIAMSVCASVPMKSAGHVFPLRRTCSSSSKVTCAQMCASPGLRNQVKWGPSSDTFECIESLHIYKHRPSLAANPGSNTDVGRVGLLAYRYHGCGSTACGPNYCCCRKGQ